jgi:AcrR family transcriptional regulator
MEKSGSSRGAKIVFDKTKFCGIILLNERSIHWLCGQLRREKMSDKRDAILKATLSLVSENGFHGTPMSRIAKEAGVSAGIIYHYFDNKEDLIDELYKKLKIDLAQAMMDGYSEDLPLHERFCRIWRNTIRYYLVHPQETAFMEQYANWNTSNPS